MTVWVDPGVTAGQVRQVAADVITGSPLVSPQYRAWYVSDDNPEALADMGDGAAIAVDIYHVPDPNLTKLATQVRDAITRELDVRARLETELPD